MEDVCNRAIIQRKLSSLPETSTLDKKSQVIWEASEAFENQRKAAITEVKNELGNMALTIAEKVIRKELKGNAEQESFVNTLVKEIHLN